MSPSVTLELVASTDSHTMPRSARGAGAERDPQAMTVV